MNEEDTYYKNVLIIGAKGFIGKNLVVRLQEIGKYSLDYINRETSVDEYSNKIQWSDIIILLAGENRPQKDSDYYRINQDLTKEIIQHVHDTKKQIPILFTSSIQVNQNNHYGLSKLSAEKALESMVELTGNPAVILTLPGVFGKWSKPYYNSVVATFCHNITRNIPIEINNADAPIRLVYIDDVIDLIIKSISERVNGLVRISVDNEYCITVGDLAKIINQMHLDRGKLFVGDVGVGFQRALYSTYISFLPKHNFKYCLTEYTDNRGSFVEMLKTRKNGQLSFLIAKPGITRGNHYHHTKTEKFLVVKGVAHFKFISIISDEIIEFITRGDKPELVDIIPGYSHSIENIGDDELVVVIWASELYDQNNPDTINIRF